MVLQARTSEEQAHRLGNEKAALINTVRKLNRDVAKLDNFKRNLLNSLQADEEVSRVQHAAFNTHAGEVFDVHHGASNPIINPCTVLPNAMYVLWTTLDSAC